MSADAGILSWDICEGGEQAFAAAWAEGEALPLDAVIAYLLGGGDESV